MKRTVPREDMGFKGISKRKKIFVGGIPTSLTDGIVEPTSYFYYDCNNIYFPFLTLW